MSTNFTQPILVECPRDAMQGWSKFIPTTDKVNYINTLLQVGFDVLDCGSFVSAKAIPQMADTALVLPQLQVNNTNTKLLVIVANERGATDAVSFEQVQSLGFPLSISETFQQLNTNSSIQESLHRIEKIQTLCVNNKKELVVYLSMGFGNPYGDKYDPQIVINLVHKLQQLGVKTISLADTVGIANPATISYLFKEIIPAYPELQIGAHFHTTPTTWQQKLEAAYNNGCVRFDGAINGIGGCPMAQEELVGNMDTSNMLSFFNNKISNTIDMEKYNAAVIMANKIFMH